MRFENSKKLYEEAKNMVPGGVSSSIRQTEWPVPLFFESAKGSKMFDVDGNEYIDYVMGMGPNIFGHSPKFIIDSVFKDMQDGFCLTGQTRKENELSEFILKTLPFKRKFRYASSGTEIVQIALRLARSYTNKNKFLKFEGHYHGWMDSVLYNSHPEVSSEESLYEPVPESGGISHGTANEVVIAPWNDVEALENILKDQSENISAIITEPILWNTNVILPNSGYLKELRNLCDKYNVLLIFDEVGTGFRVALGGAQEIYDVEPDLSTYAKSMAGGFPIAMLAGKPEIMNYMANGKVVHGGSFNTNVMSVSASHATLNYLLNNLNFYQSLNQKGDLLIEGLKDAAKNHDVDILIQGLGSVFYLSFTSLKRIENYREHANNVDNEKYKEFSKLMLLNGVRLSQNGRWHMSSSHDDSDIEKTIYAAAESFKAIS
ncbi:MAG: aspartate aminotransferase family protein [Chloroflexi bacterium]|nr:aspartate aminotransferase family protein [Chloroflexota bacterium]|tara:strand:- start:1136 stop:2431 length:1296 start_codon:yes stop_codon:yes gene_type:complete